MKTGFVILMVSILSGIAFSALTEEAQQQLSMRYDITGVQGAGILVHDRKTDMVYFCGKNLVNGCGVWGDLKALIP